MNEPLTGAVARAQALIDGDPDWMTRTSWPDPWNQCLDLDPFTGQPDQHEHGDSCDAEECCG